MRNKIAIALSALLLSVTLFGCGSSSSESASAPSMAASDAVTVKYSKAVNVANGAVAGSNESIQATFSEAETADAASGNKADGVNISAEPQAEGQSSLISVDNQQKIIFTGQLDYQTLEFDKTRNSLCSYIASIGGFQQSSSVRGGGIDYNGLKSATYVFRIPKSKYEQSFLDLRKFGNVVFEQSNGEDVTDRYFDTEARLKSLRIQEERLLELLKKAVKMEDILKLEKELQTTNYDIENLTGTLKKWDSLVEYSTLTVNINEVEKIKPVQPKENDGFFHRISSGFINSLKGLWGFIQDAVVGIAAALPILIPLGAIGYVLFRFIRRRVVTVSKPTRSSNDETTDDDKR